MNSIDLLLSKHKSDQEIESSERESIIAEIKYILSEAEQKQKLQKLADLKSFRAQVPVELYSAEEDRGQEVVFDNWAQLCYEMEKLKLLQKRSKQHWFDIFQGIMKKVQFPSLWAFLNREEIEDKKYEMIQKQVTGMLAHDQEQFKCKNQITTILRNRDKELDQFEREL